MHVSDLIECTSKVPFLPTFFKCDFNEIVVHVEQPATSPWLLWMPVVIAALAAILGSILGASIGVWHSKKSRQADDQRHLKERFAELIYKMDNVRRIADGHRHDSSTGRTDVHDKGIDMIFVYAADKVLVSSIKSALAEISAVLGYLVLVAPQDQIGAAHLAATRVRELSEVVSNPVPFRNYEGYFEHVYDPHAERYDLARLDLLLAIQSAPEKGKIGAFFMGLLKRR